MKNKAIDSDQLLSLNNMLNYLKKSDVIKDFYIVTKSKHNIVDSYVSSKSTFKCNSEWKVFYILEDILLFDEKTESNNAVRISIHN